MKRADWHEKIIADEECDDCVTLLDDVVTLSDMLDLAVELAEFYADDITWNSDLLVNPPKPMASPDKARAFLEKYRGEV